MILTLTGASGSGKTTIAGELLKEFPIESQLVPSYTTRKPRPSDISGEYKHVTRFWFWFLEIVGVFLWTVHLYGNSYGTTKRWVKKALRNDNVVYVMILTPNAVKKLKNFAEKVGYSEKVFCFYIISPLQEVLRKRLKLRGDEEEEVEKRVGDCIRWDSKIRKWGVAYEFVKNESTVKLVAEEVASRFLKKLGDSESYF